jgi:hypothetical protein
LGAVRAHWMTSRDVVWHLQNEHDPADQSQVLVTRVRREA